MPWKIRETDGEFCVMEVDTDKVMKCHPSMQDAKEHMAALYKNVEDATKGGEGSGNFGHEGRPGEVGGSGGGGGSGTGFADKYGLDRISHTINGKEISEYSIQELEEQENEMRRREWTARESGNNRDISLAHDDQRYIHDIITERQQEERNKKPESIAPKPAESSLEGINIIPNMTFAGLSTSEALAAIEREARRISTLQRQGFNPDGSPIEYDKSLKSGARNNTRDLRRLQEIHDLATENGAVCAIERDVTEIPILDADKSFVSYGGEVKALPDGKVGGYLVTFGGQDLTGEYFTKQTDFGEVARLPVMYHHGMDTTLKRRRIGTADTKMDDIGLWAEAQLELRDEYEKKIYEMAMSGKLGWSSGAAAHTVEKRADGKSARIEQWYMAEASLTPCPAEPRNQVMTLKAFLGDNSPAIPTEGEAEAVMAQSEGGTAEKSIPLSKEQNTMDEKDVALLQQAVKDAAKEAAESAVKAYRESEPPLQTAEANIQVVTDEADHPFETAGKFFMAVKSAGLYPSREDPKLRALKATGMSEGVPADGGYLIPPQYAAGIWERMYTQGNILNRISMDTVSGNSMTYNANAETSRATGSRWGGVRGYWLAEGASKTASAPTWRQVELKLKKIAALCYATDEQLEDTAALESWLQRTVPNELKFMVEDSVVNGDGVGKPLGIMQQPARVSVFRATGSATLVVADIANMLARAYNYGDSYVWLADASIIPQLVQLAITYPVYLPAGGLSAMPYDSLFGRPILYTEYNQALGTEGDIILADLSQYQAISKGGIKSASSIHVAFTTDETCFRFVYRFDGTSLWNSALTPFNAGATLSPFVTLNASSS